MDKPALKLLLDEKLDEFITWIEEQPDDKFATQITAGKWSDGEHLDHIRKSTRALNKAYKLPKLILRYKFGLMNRPEKSYAQTKEKYLKFLQENEVKAPPPYQPEKLTATDKLRLIKWLKEEKETMKAYIDKESEKNLTKYIIPHPINGKLSLREFIYLTAFHAEHHLNLMKKYNVPN